MEPSYEIAFAHETAAAVTTLLRLEVDFGLAMARLAASALATVTKHKYRARTDDELEAQCRELTTLVAKL